MTGLADAFRPPVVGIDLGSHSVKAVALRSGRRHAALLAAGEAPMPAGEPATHEQAGEVAAGLLDTLGLRRARLVCAISGPAVVVKRVTVPSASRADIEPAIAREAEQHVRFAPGHVQVDYQVMRPSRARPAGAAEVLLVVARRDRVDQRLAAMAATGCPPAVVDVEALALANAYALNYPERDDALTALVHIGQSATIVCLLEAGELVFCRDIQAGGAAYALALEREAGCTPGDARRALHGWPGVGDTSLAGVLHESHLHLVNDIRKTLDVPPSASEVTRLSRLVLSGGASRVHGLAPLLEEEFQAPVEWCDPFRRIVRPGRTHVEDADGPAFAVAVGLALRREGDR